LDLRSPKSEVATMKHSSGLVTRPAQMPIQAHLEIYGRRNTHAYLM